MSLARNIRTLDSLKIPGFRGLFLCQLGQWAPGNMQMIAQSLLLYRLTDSPMILGIVSLINAVPQMAISLFAGVWADRFVKKNIILITQGITTFSYVIVAVALSIGYLGPEHPGSWWIVLIAAMIQSIAMAAMTPARQAILVELVGRDKLMNATAINTIGMSLFQIIVPLGGGVLIDTIGFTTVYYIMTGISLTGVLFAGFIPAIKPKASAGTQNLIVNIYDGLKYSWHNPSILFIIGFTIICFILTSPQMTMMAVYADTILKVGATGMGILQSISGISALVISLIMASLPSRKRGLMLMGSGLVNGLALIIFAFSNSMPLSCVIMIITGFANTVNMLMSMTLVQTYTDDAYLGRVLSIQTLGMGLSGLGGFFSGIMADSIGVPWSIGSFAIVLAFLSVLVLAAMPKVRKLA